MTLTERVGLNTLKNVTKKGLCNSIENYIKPLRIETTKKLKKTLYDPNLNSNPFSLITDNLKQFTSNLTKILTEKHKNLSVLVNYALSNSGKRIRPSINILIANALRQTNSNNNNFKEFDGLDYSSNYQRQLRLSEVSELVHTGSLLHDDVIDESDTRRGNESVRKHFSNRVAILGGDYFLSKACISLSYINNNEVLKLISKSIESLVSGELVQVNFNGEFDLEQLLNTYCHKNYLKTASLMANSCKGIAVLSENSKEIIEEAYSYGKNIGLCFQIIDDLLDVSPEYSNTGKPKNADLKQGIITAPVLFSADENPEVLETIRRGCLLKGDLEVVSKSLLSGNALERSKELAEMFALKAVKSALKFPESPFRDALVSMARFNLERVK